MMIAWYYETGNLVNQGYNMVYKYLKVAVGNGHELSTEFIKCYRKNIFGNYYIPQ